MNRIRTLIVLLSLVAIIPATSYALVDIGAYGGYSFAGKLETTGEDVEPSGWEYGFIAHYNKTILPMILSFGFGAYYQKSALNYDLLNKDYDFDKQSAGIDAYLQLELPIIIHPYGRVSATAWEKTGGDADSNTEYFKSYSAGAGIAMTIFPLLQLYGEYLYNFGEVDGKKTTGNSAHLGLRLNI